ncbi:MAG: potassium transporter KefB [candidate division Zixibacteria bacterium]|nr:potassium transporter KefB [candidate division Zixibacteria bacterium]
MNELHILRDLVIVLGLGVAIVAAFQRFRVPAIAGFILAGVLAGPKGLGLVADSERVQNLSEIGVTLLLFGIGLELPIDRIRRIWRLLLVGGFVQVFLSIVATMIIGQAVGLSVPAAVFIGFIIAVSSTAIVLRGLEQRGEIDAPHGRFTVGVLIFQDMCVVPMMLMIPILAGTVTAPLDIALTLLESAAIIAIVIAAGRSLVPRLLEVIARTRQRHLFIMTVLLICVGTALLSAAAGVSLALGAFLAGTIVAGSEYRHQATADIIPFKEVFVSLFFISVGMLLDLRAVVAEAGPIILLLAAIMVGKAFIVFVTAMLMRLSLRVSVMSSAALAQVGEFSFVLMGAAGANMLIDEPLAGNLTAAIVLSMLGTPLLLSVAPSLAERVGRTRLFPRLFRVSADEEIADSVQAMRNHVIIGGYGLAGRDLACALKDCDIPYVIAELNPENIHSARENGEPIHFGDITSAGVLERLGASRAAEFVIVINDPTAIERAVRAARSIAPKLHILVRTRYVMDAKLIQKAGASEVVPAELEAAVEVTTRVLARHGVDSGTVNSECARIRKGRQQGTG